VNLGSRFAASGTLAEARQVVREPDFRRAIIAGVVALAAPGAVLWLGGIYAHPIGFRIGAFAAIAACLLFGVIAVRSTANEVGRLVRAQGAPAIAGGLRLVITLVGYVIVLITVLSMLTVPLDKLLLSGAITGVIVGIAAQQSLGNAFAGLVLLFARPFAVGDYITLRSGSLGGQYDGEVVAITLMYTVLETDEGPMSIPNSGVLAAATGPRTRVLGPAGGPGGDEQNQPGDQVGEHQQPDHPAEGHPGR
jgi:small-conductance mechanosensitive channel